VNRNRLEAFSNGGLAVVITIMLPVSDHCAQKALAEYTYRV
jgi:uncharacterized membrane protein